MLILICIAFYALILIKRRLIGDNNRQIYVQIDSVRDIQRYVNEVFDSNYCTFDGKGRLRGYQHEYVFRGVGLTFHFSADNGFREGDLQSLMALTAHIDLRLI